MATLCIIGPGRAGRSIGRALSACGHEVSYLSRSDSFDLRARQVDAVIIATPDDTISSVAQALLVPDRTCVLHLSGSLGCDVLAPHTRTGALHPLIPMPNEEIGAARIQSGCTFAVAGDPLCEQLATDLGGRVVKVADKDRATYHAAACIAANHVVALLGQVERVAATAGIDLDAFLSLTRAALDDVATLGPEAALTGPASRSDWATLQRHLDALDESERAGYGAGVGLAITLATGGNPSPVPEHTAAAIDAEIFDEIDDVPELRSPVGV